MDVRRLGWAGLELETSHGTAVVDLLEDAGPLGPYVGEPREPLPPPRAENAALALVTHLHSDHCDPEAIARALGPEGVLLRPVPMNGGRLETAGTAVAEAALVETGIHTQVVEPWETVRVGPFEVTVVPAADGFGDPQVSWVVAAEGRRFVHAGDTLFHGWWWLAAMRRGPFDAAFLPVNGALVDLPHRQPPSPLPAVMDPYQAAVAAAALGTDLAVPIHYGAFHNPPIYSQVTNPAEAFAEAAAAREVEARLLGPGESL